MKSDYAYIIFYKPYGVLSQFTSPTQRPTLNDFQFPKHVYSVGRLDADSEGLLLLTNDGLFKHLLIEPRFNHPRTYAVQVENIPDPTAIHKLSKGVIVDGQSTKPAKVRRLEPAPVFPPRSKPIRYRAHIPTSWIEISITEGRNRQIRKMTAAVGHPTLRLIRTQIMGFDLKGLSPGEWRYMTQAEVEKMKTQLLHTKGPAVRF